jgi:predicted aspartyl protease
MSDEMGTFRIDIEIENPARPGVREVVHCVLVDTGAELSWIPAHILDRLGVQPGKLRRFRQANGTTLERSTGYAIVHAAGAETVDEVVFGEPADLVLLGARSLEGMNLRVDSASKSLVDGGPAPAAVAT